jgi:hypothetical protein
VPSCSETCLKDLTCPGILESVSCNCDSAICAMPKIVAVGECWGGARFVSNHYISLGANEDLASQSEIHQTRGFHDPYPGLITKLFCWSPPCRAWDIS